MPLAEAIRQARAALSRMHPSWGGASDQAIIDEVRRNNTLFVGNDPIGFALRGTPTPVPPPPPAPVPRPAPAPTPGPVTLPHHISPAVWDTMSPTGRKLLLDAYSAGGGTPQDFLFSLNATRPRGNPPPGAIRVRYNAPTAVV